MLLTSLIQDVSGLQRRLRDRNARPMEKLEELEARTEPEQRPESCGDCRTEKSPSALEEALPQEAQEHKEICPGRKGRAFGLAWRGGDHFGEDRQLSACGGTESADMLSRSSWIDAAQRDAGRFGRAGTHLPFKEFRELLAPQGTSRNEMLGQYSFRTLSPRPAQSLAENCRDADKLPSAIASDGPARRVGVKLKLVMFPTERAAPQVHSNSDEGDEVLKLFNGMGTLPCSVWWRGRSKPAKACGRPRSFPSHAQAMTGGGETPLAKDATLFWQVGEESGKSHGRGTAGLVNGIFYG